MPAHKSAIAMAKSHELRFELVPLSPYSPVMIPRDHHLFPNLNKWLGDKRFSSNSEVITSVNSYYDALDSSLYNKGIVNLGYL